MSYSIKRDPILDVKHTFLRLLQAYFGSQVKYKWDKDIRKTRIVILDKHALDLGVNLKRPAIVLNRQGMSWTYVNGHQKAENVFNLKGITEYETLEGEAPNVTKERTKKYTDLLVGNLIFTVLSKNGVEAERIATIIFTLFTSLKDELRSDGIHKVTRLAIGPEQVVKQNSEHELVSVNVSLTYYKQQMVKKDDTYYDIVIYINGEALEQGFDYNVDLDGQTIRFFREIPSGSEVTADYIDAITLDEVKGVSLIATGDPLIYLIPNGATIHGYYVPLQNIEVDIQYA